MSEHRGRTQYLSVVVPYRPGRKVAVVLLLLLLQLLLTVLAFWAGGHWLRDQHDRQSADYKQLQQQFAELRQQWEQVSQSEADLSVGAQVDREAVELIREVVRDQSQEIADLREEIAFYKSLMAPSDLERGLSVRDLTLLQGADSGRVFYKLVVQQLALKHNLLKGSVAITVTGLLAGEERSYSLASLSGQLADNSIKLRFKYFQTIEGELQLPADFEPQRVDVVAQSDAPSAMRIEKRFNWALDN